MLTGLVLAVAIGLLTLWLLPSLPAHEPSDGLSLAERLKASTMPAGWPSHSS